MRRQQTTGERQRRLFLQQLEARECLAFTFGGFNNNILALVGTSAADTLSSIYVGTNGNVWFRTPAGEFPTTAPAPTALAPIAISIDGLGGNDVVDLLAGSATLSENNLGGQTKVTFAGTTVVAPPFPIDSVTYIHFSGSDGLDTFTPPEGRPGTAKGGVLLPAPGGSPNIKFYGGNHDDTLNNGDHPELFYGEHGDDIVAVTGGGGGNDRLYGGDGIDTLAGGAGNDQIDGQAQGDQLFGGGGDDTLNGGIDADLLVGGAGYDVLNGDEGSDFLIGGPDADLIYTGSSGATIETAQGGGGDDVIYADTATNSTSLQGGDGNDWIVGSGFRDFIFGEAGDDTMYGEDGPDMLDSGFGTNTLNGGPGDDGLIGTVVDTFVGGPDNDNFNAGVGDFIPLDLDTEADWHPKITTIKATDAAGLEIGEVVKKAGAVVNLTAGGVADTGGTAPTWITRVEVWHEPPGGDGLLNRAEDVLLGNAVAVGGDYTYSVDISKYPVGARHFYMLAYDDDGTYGAPDRVAVTIKAAPEAEDDAYFRTFGPGGIVSVAKADGVLANDSDEDDETITAVLYSGPSNGLLTFNDDGSFSYERSSGSVTYDKFEYRAYDGENYSEVATVELNLTNPSPESQNDAYSMSSASGNLTVYAPGVLENDVDPDSQPLTVVSWSSPANGNVSPNPDGSFSYTPTTGFVGTDSFTYQASDGYSWGSAVTVSIEVTNQLPTANSDVLAVQASSGTTFVSAPGVLGNDSDGDGQALTAVLDCYPTNGAVYLNADGSYGYTPNPGYVGTDSFSYHASDGWSSSSSTAVTITVVNNVPVANSDSYSMTANSGPLNIYAPGVLGNDSDMDGHTTAAAVVGYPSNGSLSLNADGSFSYTPNTNFAGTDSFTYEASDTFGTSSSASVTITVTNNAPQAYNDSYSVGANGSLYVSAPGVLVNDYDADWHTLSVSGASQPGHGTVSMNADGSFTYFPASGYVGSDSFDYTASDGITTSTATVSIDVTNSAPSAASDAYSIGANGTLSVNSPGVLGNDSDPDGHSLSASLGSGPANGSLTFNADGSFSYTPATGFVGNDSFTYSASDGHGGSSSATVSITVENNPPVAENDSYSVNNSYGYGGYGGTLNVSAPGVLGNDADPNGHSLSAGVVANPSHGSLTFNADGSFTYTPAFGYVGNDSFTYQASDGYGSSNVATVTIDVTAALMFAGTAIDNELATTISEANVSLMLVAAAARWEASGASPELLADLLGSISIVITDLPGSRLAVVGSTLQLDFNAAGRGWFVDSTPLHDVEFDSTLQAVDLEAAVRVDLLTAVMHELGHRLGLAHAEHGVMEDALGVGRRRLPTE